MNETIGHALALEHNAAIEPVARAPLTSDEQERLDRKVVDGAVSNLMTYDVGSKEFKGAVNAVSSIATAEIRKSTTVSNRLLDKPMRTLDQKVMGNLLAMRRQLNRIDPEKQGLVAKAKRVVMKVPGGKRVMNMVESQKSAKEALDEIAQALFEDRDDLQRDIASMETEQELLDDMMTKLEKFEYVTSRIDKRMTEEVARLDLGDAADRKRAKVLKREVLFGMRQQRMDLMNHLAVCLGTYTMMDIERMTNEELVKSVERATTTGMAAARQAVMSKQIVNRQQQVATNVQTFNGMTNSFLLETSRTLKQNVDTMIKISTETGITPETLHEVFSNAYEALDRVDRFKLEGLDKMQAKIDSMQGEINKTRAQLAQRKDAQAIGTDERARMALTVD